MAASGDCQPHRPGRVSDNRVGGPTKDGTVNDTLTGVSRRY